MIDDLRDLADVIGDHTGPARTVLDYTVEMKRIIDRAKEPGFSAADWDALARFVAVDDFARVGPFKDEMDWSAYVTFLTSWAPNRHWECSFRRITAVGDVVFCELEERSEPGNSAAGANSLSVYGIDADGLIHSLDVYLQLPS